MIQIHGVITDPAGQAVPGAIIELRSLNTTGEVLMGSVLTFKCDPAGGYRFQLAAGTYDVYAQNDLCGDMDYLGTGVVTAQSAGGPLNSILVDSGINLTPPLLDRAVEAMLRSEAAAEATAEDRGQTGSDAMTAEQARLSATEQAAAASASAAIAGRKAAEAATSAVAAAGSASSAQKWAENPVGEAVVTGQFSARHHAIKAGISASESSSSATAAAASASTASAMASNANTSASTAMTKANEAATSASTAATQASAASSSKVAAETSATNAGTHASNAEKAAQMAESAKVLTLDNAAKVGTLAEQVTAERAQVHEKASLVAANAATVAEQTKEVSTNADAVSQVKAAIQGMRDVVMAKTTQAEAAADTASSKASQAAQDQASANASALRASASEGMAEAWAQNPEGSDINGRPGEFSALHWAMQAQKWAKAITSQLVWLGAWNAAAGTPPTPAAHQGIPFYRISHDGVIAGVSYLAGDYLHWDPATKGWFKIDGSDAVISVNGMTGAVVLSAADVGARPASWVPRWADITNKPVSMPPSEHSHPWSQLSNVPIYASRWPTLAEIGAAAADHHHPWSQLTGIPVFAKRWPAWTEVTGKPELAAAKHRHPWSQIDQIPVTASRWPSWAEVTDKPALAAADHTHPYMANGGSYGTLYLNNWFRSTGATGWYNETYGGGIYMEDATWVRTYNGKKFHVSNTEGDCVSLAGGIYAAGNANVNDVYIRSDYRLKSNFEPISDALCKVRQLSGKIYDKAGRREAGLIAQDVAKVQPESVYLNEDGYLSLASTGILALVVEALKELDEKVEALDDRS
ncbi:tail fiber domain-containing protein [Aeromonas hydrophila]